MHEVLVAVLHEEQEYGICRTRHVEQIGNRLTIKTPQHSYMTEARFYHKDQFWLTQSGLHWAQFAKDEHEGRTGRSIDGGHEPHPIPEGAGVVPRSSQDRLLNSQKYLDAIGRDCIQVRAMDEDGITVLRAGCPSSSNYLLSSIF